MDGAEMYSKKAQMEKQDLEIRNSLGKIKKTILVMSGKGGVGKSCIAVNIAVKLVKYFRACRSMKSINVLGNEGEILE